MKALCQFLSQSKSENVTVVNFYIFVLLILLDSLLSTPNDFVVVCSVFV